jgi:hypothetical protein
VSEEEKHVSREVVSEIDTFAVTAEGEKRESESAELDD